MEFKAVVTSDNAHKGEEAPVLDNLEPMQEVPVPESQLSQQYLHETVGLDTVVVGPDGHGETIGALYSKVYDPEGNQLPGVDNQAVEAFNDAYRQAERISENRVEGYTMAAQDAALGMAAGPVAGVAAGAAKKVAGPLIDKAKSALGALRRADVPKNIKPVVTAEAWVNGSVFKDVNQTARVGANAGQPTLIAERIAEKSAQSGKVLPNGNMGAAHAEVGAIQQAFDAGVTAGADMTLTVTGKAVCGFCRGDVAAMAKKAKLKSLTVYEEATGNILYWKPGMKSLKKAK
ncbi:hypothetical protein [Marinobacter sp. ANT_B65]|uniref:cytidine deaminase-like fold-containing protein n=1 Tax=Marinobacter sp. ANT_B65 TaxID=2039467 RepID=UPI0022282A9B|nr:hypothetical protein [Marinobacter sp. ANT_B65]